MDNASPGGRKYIVGWLTCRPGRRDALLSAFGSYARACLAEEGCLFFEVGPSIHDENVVVVTECFASPEAHDRHLEGASFLAFRDGLADFCLRGNFENVFPRHVVPDTATFATE
jgi:quinol monooxygenase YgiN